MEIVIVVGIIVFLIWIFRGNNNSSSTNKTVTETEYQRQVRLQREREARERQAAIDRQNQIERERQATLRKQQAEAEKLRRQAELNRQAEQRRIAEQQRQVAERQRLAQQAVNFKTNWQEFQRVFKQNRVIKLYHFTDRANLPSIRNKGGLYSWWKADELGIEVPMPGGIGFGRDLDRRHGLQNYVRLCFTKQHPMLYIAKREGRIINPVILEIKLEVAYLKETRFSNMNATKNGHQQGKTLADLERIRFDLVLQPNQFDISDAEKHFYQAEILVLEKIPLNYITNINNV
jgi:hypothetical protein